MILQFARRDRNCSVTMTGLVFICRSQYQSVLIKARQVKASGLGDAEPRLAGHGT